MSYTDSRILCDRHVGEAVPPRCVTCDALTREWEALNPPRARELSPEYLDGPVTCSIDNPCPQCLREAARA